MNTFEYIPSRNDDEDRAYIPADDAFDIATLRVEEGLVINTCDNDSLDFLGKYFLDERFLPRNREERP